MATGGMQSWGHGGYRSHAHQLMEVSGVLDPQPIHLTPIEARAIYADDPRMLDFIDQGHVAVVDPSDEERYERATTLRNAIQSGQAMAYQRAQAEAFAKGGKDGQARLTKLLEALNEIANSIDPQGAITVEIPKVRELARRALTQWNQPLGGP